MKKKNILTLGISIILVFAVILSSACNKATITTTSPSTKTTTSTATSTSTKTTTTSTTTPISDTTPPAVTFTNNANGATNVPINTKLGVFFTETMDPLTINTSTLTLMQGTTPVSGEVVYAGAAATFTPDCNLAANATYTATITTGAKDLAGNALASPYTWSWTTGAAPDATIPSVISTKNANGATNVPVNTKAGAFFNEAMDPLTINNTTFTLMQGTTPVSGTVSYIALAATFTPSANLAANTTYTATITTGAKDLAGNAMASPYTWSWTTAAAADTSAPTVISTSPVNGATSIAVSSVLTAVFSEAMDPLTVTTLTFTLMQGTTPVVGIVTYLGMTATFTPASEANRKGKAAVRAIKS